MQNHIKELRESGTELFLEIIWSVEVSFKLSGHVNRHDRMYWYTENQNNVIDKQLNEPGVTNMGGILCHGVTVHYFFDETVTVE